MKYNVAFCHKKMWFTEFKLISRYVYIYGFSFLTQ